MTVPVVFHVVHNGEPEGSGGNISTERILEQLDIVNDDFNRTNADADATPAAFAGVAVSIDLHLYWPNETPKDYPPQVSPEHAVPCRLTGC